MNQVLILQLFKKDALTKETSARHNMLHSINNVLESYLPSDNCIPDVRLWRTTNKIFSESIKAV
jgi:hypothetical protein